MKKGGGGGFSYGGPKVQFGVPREEMWGDATKDCTLGPQYLVRGGGAQQVLG